MDLTPYMVSYYQMKNGIGFWCEQSKNKGPRRRQKQVFLLFFVLFLDNNVSKFEEFTKAYDETNKVYVRVHKEQSTNS